MDHVVADKVHTQMIACLCLLRQSWSVTFWCRESDNHTKALYRRALAYAALGEYDKAETDLRKWEQVEPSASADAAAQLVKMKATQKAATAKQKQQFKNFFERT